jgi:hypothetical protein
VNMGSFLNEIEANLLIASVVFVVIASPIFGYFYNRLMDSLKGEYEHMSLYVAIGVAISLVLVALISWKAALVALGVFTLTGLPMIIGEFLRTERKRKSAPRRKRLPYAANGILDEAKIAATDAQRHMTRALTATKPEDVYRNLAAAATELNTINNKISEVKQIQMEK